MYQLSRSSKFAPCTAHQLNQHVPLQSIEFYFFTSLAEIAQDFIFLFAALEALSCTSAPSNERALGTRIFHRTPELPICIDGVTYPHTCHDPIAVSLNRVFLQV